MTAHKNRKRLVRARAQRTGESYTAALHHLRSAQTEPVGAIGHPQVPHEARSILRRYQALLDEQLPGRIGGLYLVGAVALGEFDLRDDQLDFIAASDAPLTETDRSTCNAIHQMVQSEFATPSLDGLYVTWEQLGAAPPRDPQTITAWNDGRLAPADVAGYPVSKVNPVTWTTLAQHGITLRGPDARELPIHQDRAELTAWNLRNLDTYWHRTARMARQIPREAAAAFDPRKFVWAILGPPRLHYTISTGRITTKDAAGEYALANFPSQWHGLIRAAIATHRGDISTFGEATDDPFQLAIAGFIDFVVSDARRIADRCRRRSSASSL